MMNYQTKTSLPGKSIVITSAAGLTAGSLLGMIGSIIPSDIFRNITWGLGSASLILAALLLTMFYFRKGWDLVAAGFLAYAIAESVVFASSATSLEDNIGTLGAGTFLWALSIAVLSLQKVFPLFVRITGMIASVLFAVFALRIFSGDSLNALSKPLPFFAMTLVGWAWTLLRRHAQPEKNFKIQAPSSK
jgi:hypothetical protein